MSDFISLTCPNCGAQLQRMPGAASLRCNYCRTEHLFKDPAPGAGQESEFVTKKDWETKAVEFKTEQTIEDESIKCPVCNIGKEVHLLHLFYSNVNTSDRADFPQLDGDIPLIPVPKQLPPYKKPISVPFFIVIILVNLWISFLLLRALSTETGGIFVIVCNILAPGSMFVLMTGLLIFNKPVSSNVKKAVEARQQMEKAAEKQYQQEMFDYRARQLEFEKRQKQYQEKISIWRELYICTHDHVVFLPGDSGHAPVNERMAFIGQEWKRRQEKHNHNLLPD